MPSPQELLDRLDARHDELIRKLDDLNSQIESALAQFATARHDDASSESLGEMVSGAAAGRARLAA